MDIYVYYLISFLIEDINSLLNENEINILMDMFDKWLKIEKNDYFDLEIIDRVIYYKLKKMDSYSLNNVVIPLQLTQAQDVLSIKNQDKLKVANDIIKLSENLPEQRSPEWFEMRKNAISASDIATAINENPYEKRNKFILYKAGVLVKEYKSNIYTEWGVKYEPIAQDIFKHCYNVELDEVSLIPHNTISFLAASPDGIIRNKDNGYLIEIKCPYTREIKGNPPKYYWHQVQLQLEVCNLDYCFFYECSFMEYNNCNEYFEDSQSEDKDYISKDGYPKGMLIQYCEGDNLKVIYGNLHTNFKENVKILLNKSQNIKSCKIIFWKLKKFNINCISRDLEWMNKYFPMIEETWNDVLKLRSNNNTDKNEAKNKLWENLNSYELSNTEMCAFDDD